jgi:dipeptidyl-peptidase-4
MRSWIRSATVSLLALGASVSAGLGAGCGGPALTPPPAPAPPRFVPPIGVIAAAEADAARGARAPAGRVSPRGPEASPITFARMAKFPEPGWNVPRAIALSPDDKLVTFLASEDASDKMSIMAFDRQTKQTSVLLRASDLPAATRPRSREEELRRERTRQLVEGLTSYRWARRAPVMLVPHGGDLFLRDAKGAVTRLTDTPEPEIDAHLCDSGDKVAFVRKGELVVLDVATKKETALTKGAPEGVTRGLSDFNAQEEFGEESGFAWSPTCDRIAYFEVDERKVDTTPVLGWRGGKPDLMMQKYTPPGGTNPSVRLGVIDLRTRKTTWAAWPDSAERYMVELHWKDDGKALYLQAIDRAQKRRAFVKLDPATGKTAIVAQDDSPQWVDASPMRPLSRADKGELLFTDDTTGHRHLVVLRDGKARFLTKGDWDVTSLVAVDEERGRALFVGTKDGPLERQLYAVPLAGGEPVRLSKAKGSHRIAADERGRAWVDLYSAHDAPPRAEVFQNDAASGEIPVKLDDDFAALRIRAPELFTVKGADGGALHAALLEPRDFDPRAHYPAIVMVYGGPGAQLVIDAWMPRLLWQHLADRGFFVLQVDNRGSAGRGPAFEKQIYGRLGQLELADQVAAAAWLGTQPGVDRARIGIVGHSYGGFMSALAMLKAPGTFAAGVAIAPVTDWTLYDSAYTERFMGTPKDNPKGYEAADLTRAAAGLAGPLFLVHGNMDENVHYTNTAKLIEALVAADKPFDQLAVPGERHFMRNVATRAYVEERIVTWLAQRLR